MPRMIYDYTKSTLEKVSPDLIRFERELNKAKKCLHEEEIEVLVKWLRLFTINKRNLNTLVMNKFNDE
ncbi:hypothetical protein [Flavobacterium sp.]|jgi:hypothetical protein|uniref:hypothetical protein n=1 Tax=Flavobacterium sp. TaxID=239 RepID=UPI002A82C8DB|nr:hypothetical protein [Flavobacterium sp.]